jgi:hypothetical protein
VRGNSLLAADVQAAYLTLGQIADCLHYPPRSGSPPSVNSQGVAQEMERLLQTWQAVGSVQQAQKDLISALRKRWNLYGKELLYCYDIAALPQDNLHLEALFGRLRRHQRRISGRQSTRELQMFGQIQVLFQAESEADLLKQIQRVSPEEYAAECARLKQAEFPSQFFQHLHHDPLRTVQALLRQHADCGVPLPLQNNIS